MSCSRTKPPSMAILPSRLPFVQNHSVFLYMVFKKDKFHKDFFRLTNPTLFDKEALFHSTKPTPSKKRER
jgi:hypothetical protein